MWPSNNGVKTALSKMDTMAQYVVKFQHTAKVQRRDLRGFCCRDDRRE